MITRLIIYSTLIVLIIVTVNFRLNGIEQVPNRSKPPATETVRRSQHEDLLLGRGVSGNQQELISLPRPPIPTVVAEGQTAQVREKREKYEKARERFGARDYSAAVELLGELPEGDQGVLTYLGVSYFNLGDYPRAIAGLKKALELNPRDLDARKALSLAYYKIDDLPKALSHMEVVLAAADDPELHLLHAKLKRENQTQADFVGESADHFRVLYDGYTHGRVSREVIGLLEDAYRHIGGELHCFPVEPVTAILYTDRDFTDTTRAPLWAGGLYDGKIRVPVRGITGFSPTLKKVLFHEYTHALVHSIARQCPLWIDEGLAEYFSNTYSKKCGQIIPLSYLETSFNGLGSEKSISIAYWESWSAVSYLVERHGLYKMKDLLVAFASNADPDQAFRSSLGISYNDFLQQWGKD